MVLIQVSLVIKVRNFRVLITRCFVLIRGKLLQVRGQAPKRINRLDQLVAVHWLVGDVLHMFRSLFDHFVLFARLYFILNFCNDGSK